MTNHSQARTRIVVLVAIGAAFMSSLDLFVVNVAFDDIGSGLGVGRPGGPTTADLSWVLNAYAVVFASLLVPFGRLADRYGRKLLFVGGLVTFVLASAACAAAGDVWVLVGFRALQAVGAAAMTPTSLSILLAALPAERRAGGVRLWAATGAIAAAIGPSVGGLLTQLGWQWVFAINLPVGAVLLVLAVREVHEPRPEGDTTTPDLLGALLFAATVGLLALGLVKSPEWGWGSARTLVSLGGSVLAGLAFTARSRRHPSPVIHPELLRVATFRWAVLAMFAFNVAFAANLLVGILWLQQVWGYSALTTGFAVAAGPVMVPVTAALAHRFLGGVRPGHLAAAGSLVCAAGIVVLVAGMGPEPAYASSYLPGWLLGGVGVGLALPNLLAGATSDLAAHQSSTGSGVVTMARQIGFVVGVSILFAVVGDRAGSRLTDGFVDVWWISAGVLVLSALTALGMVARTHEPAPAVAGAGSVSGA
jgi:EmrB/QacA subfamily drug resistance transporter